jgi:hypothetical protein
MSEEMVPRNEMTKQAMRGAVGVGGGIVALIVGGVLTPIPLLGWILGGLLGIGGVGMIIYGGFSLYKFIKNMQKRS